MFLSGAISCYEYSILSAVIFTTVRYCANLVITFRGSRITKLCDLDYQISKIWLEHIYININIWLKHDFKNSQINIEIFLFVFFGPPTLLGHCLHFPPFFTPPFSLTTFVHWNVYFTVYMLSQVPSLGVIYLEDFINCGIISEIDKWFYKEKGKIRFLVLF